MKAFALAALVLLLGLTGCSSAEPPAEYNQTLLRDQQLTPVEGSENADFLVGKVYLHGGQVYLVDDTLAHDEWLIRCSDEKRDWAVRILGDRREYTARAYGRTEKFRDGKNVIDIIDDHFFIN